MFRENKCTIKRPKSVIVEGETTWLDPELIVENMPCHLSVKTISPTNQTQSTANVLYDYVLFYDRDLNIEIKPNDEIEVERFGKMHKLKAGESVNYLFTVQTHCEVIDIV